MQYRTKTKRCVSFGCHKTASGDEDSGLLGSLLPDVSNERNTLIWNDSAIVVKNSQHQEPSKCQRTMTEWHVTKGLEPQQKENWNITQRCVSEATALRNKSTPLCPTGLHRRKFVGPLITHIFILIHKHDLKSSIHFQLYTRSSSRAVNTLSIGYKNQSVNAV